MDTTTEAAAPRGDEAPRAARTPDFYSLRCLDEVVGDPLLEEVREAMRARSVLGVLREWTDARWGALDNDARTHTRLRRLFESGATPPAALEGHHDGVALGLRTGDQGPLVAPFGNVAGALWRAFIGPSAPWMGKSFSARRDATGPFSLGINHFRRVEGSLVGGASFAFINRWMRLDAAPAADRERYGHARDGGRFVARRAASVWSQNPRPVMQLNYRLAELANVFPFCLLIDELVELSDGLYLGQLLFATAEAHAPFAPEAPPERYCYQHFGYFILADDRWSAEVRRVFSTLGPLGFSAPSAPPPPSAPARAKFTRLLADAEDGRRDAALFAQVHRDLSERATVLDGLHAYAREAARDPRNCSAPFAKLGELFNRCVAPREIRGHLRGAVLTFHAEGLYRLGGLNTLNALWKLARTFSPWTGKTFEPLSRERLLALTEGAEAGDEPTSWGSNTLSFRSGRERLVRRAMRLASIWMEDASAEERVLGVEARSFFFLARQGRSAVAANQGKRVLQLNYRWPRLRTMPPDNYCIDEVVEVADGLYLGQLNYATELRLRYDPHLPHARYDYRVFGYFLLMDEEWHRRRLAIGLDAAS